MLFGLFLDGVGRWGWASIVESGDSVRPPPSTHGCKLKLIFSSLVTQMLELILPLS
jgi:hypothetical protein